MTSQESLCPLHSADHTDVDPRKRVAGRHICEANTEQALLSCDTITKLLYQNSVNLWQTRLLLYIAYFTALHGMHTLWSWLAVNAICCWWGDVYEWFALYAIQALPLKRRACQRFRLFDYSGTVSPTVLKVKGVKSHEKLLYLRCLYIFIYLFGMDYGIPYGSTSCYRTPYIADYRNIALVCQSWAGVCSLGIVEKINSSFLTGLFCVYRLPGDLTYYKC